MGNFWGCLGTFSAKYLQEWENCSNFVGGKGELSMREFYEDKAIQTKEEDLYGRNRLVENIAKVIEAKTKDEHSSFTIGVYGAWGEGKTSVLNLLKELLSNKDNIVICSFNPWILSSQEAIIQEFFISICNALSSSTENSVTDFIKRYGGLVSYAMTGVGYALQFTPVPILPMFLQNAAKQLDKIRALLPEREPLSKQKKRINEELKKSCKHLVVFVDDLDRLDKEEIHMVFRLIRQVADFENVIYVVAMDVNKVASAISSFYGNDINEGYQFVEKIINFPVLLPQVNPRALKEFADSQLESMLDINQIKSDDRGKVIKYLSQLFSTKREWVRYLNNLQIMLDLTKGEVNQYDLCLIEALRTIAPAIESLIYNQKELLCGSVESSEIFGKKYQETKTKKSKLLDDIITKIPTTKQEISIRILNQLFPEQYNGLNFDHVIHKRICSAIYFDKYFIKQILHEYISDVEIDEVSRRFINAEKDNVVSWIDAKIDEYSIDETMRALEMMITRQVTTEQKKTMARCIIKSLIHTKETQRYSYTLFVDGKGNSSCTKLMVIWLPKYIVNDIPNTPDGIVKPDVEMISELLNYILVNAPIAYCMNLLTNFDYLYRTILKNPPIEYFKDACASLEKRLYEIGNVEFVKYSSFLQYSLFCFWIEVDKEGLNKFFKQLIDDTKIDVLSYINRLETEDTLDKIIVEFPDLYEILLNHVVEHKLEVSSKGVERLFSNQSLLDNR